MKQKNLIEISPYYIDTLGSLFYSHCELGSTMQEVGIKLLEEINSAAAKRSSNENRQNKQLATYCLQNVGT
jgi:hypothetical protein